MVKNFGDDTMIYSWMRNRNTLEFIGIWEELHNPSFNSNEFVTFKSQAGLNSFNLTIQEKTPQAERLRKLNQIVIQQMRLLTNDTGIKRLESGDK